MAPCRGRWYRIFLLSNVSIFHNTENSEVTVMSDVKKAPDSSFTFHRSPKVQASLLAHGTGGMLTRR